MSAPRPPATSPLLPAGSPTATIAPRYALGEQPGSYVAQWRGQPVAPPSPADGNDEWVLSQTGHCRPHPGPSVGNYLVRRDPVALVSGDLPRFALLDYRRTPTHKPGAYLLGDVRLRVQRAGESFWLDERGHVETHYLPWGTEHRVELDSLQFTITAALVDSCGMALSVTVEKRDAAPVAVRLCYGGLGIADLRGGDRPECLLFHPEQEANDRIEIAEGAAQLADEAIPYGVRVQADAAAAASVVETDGGQRRAAFRWLVADRTTHLQLVAGKQVAGAAPLEAARATQYIAETKQYYADLLAGLEIGTPDPLVDAAFYSAIVGLDYVYAAPGWLEGLTDWATYFSNNYQLSAAVALRWDARVKAALRFFALQPGGPGQIYLPDGSVDSADQSDGLLYAILQLYYYWKATGDRATLAEVWPAFCRALERFVARRDADGDGLLDFHKGCNAFLYQADHLSLPGAGFSPSVMLAAMLPRLAEMAGALGQTGQADRWRGQADRVNALLLERFWSPAEGRFVAAIDPQGRRQVASYFTDFAFPALYSQLPAEQCYRPLLAMDQALSLGACLLRTGNYRPDLFGNNGVHQVGMCEAAEAQFRQGRAERGWELLHGTAVGATVISYCPGTFYEFASWDGQGLLNKQFGNPIGCYLQAVVAGLFGFIRSAAPLVQVWQPAIPAAWPHARLRLGSTELEITGEAAARSYCLRGTPPQAAALRLPLHGRLPERVVDHAGQDVAFQIEPHPAGDFLHLERPAATEHLVRVTLQTAAAAPRPSPWPRRAPPASPARVTLTGRQLPLELTTHFNSDRIRPDSFWSYLVWSPGGELTYDLRPYLQAAGIGHEASGSRLQSSVDRESGVLALGDYRFAVRPTGQNLVALALGDYAPATNLPEPATVPAQLTLPVGRRITGLEFLTVAEPRVRLTGMEAGCVECCYADGSTATIPLIVGEQLDATLAPYATRTTVLKFAKGAHGLSKHLAAWRIAVDPARVTATVTVRVTSFDIMLGILGINVRLVDEP